MKKPQTLSLQEQLLKSGLASDAKAKQVKSDKRKQSKQQRNNGIETEDRLKRELEQARLLQAERDRELNRFRKQSEEQKAILAQIKQIVESNRIPQDENAIPYQFSDDNKVKSVYVTQSIREDLINGKAGIIKIDSGYEIVTIDIALKIQARHAPSLVVLNQTTQHSGSVSDDPYAAYQIPDDLLW